MDAAPIAHDPTVRLLVLQATQLCNIDCTYCYVPNRTRAARLSPDVAAAIHREIVEAGRLTPRALVLWHAGEPLTVGPDRLDALRRALFGGPRPAGIREQIQTNATLIDAGWADYFAANDITLGVSIDGPAWIHDARRVNRAGRGTLDATLRGIAALNAARADFSTITVVGDHSLDRAAELFEFLRGLGPKVVGFTIEKIEGANLESSLEAARHFDRVREFFRTVTTLNARAGHPVAIREVVQTAAAIDPAGPERGGSDEATLGRIVSVSLDGDVGFFSPEMITNPARPPYGRFTFGNLLDEPYLEIERRAAESLLRRDIVAGVEACRSSCEYWRFCGGGSPSAKISEHGSARTTATSFCRLQKQAATLGILSSIADSTVPTTEIGAFQ
jgi:uncharacterized protein